jgi:hypothetical protein
MDAWLARFSKATIATVAIVGGIIFIVLSDPPHTVCDSQKELVKSSQQRFLFLDPKKKLIKTTQYEVLRDHCKGTNSPGGCYELFQEIKNLLQDLRSVPAECKQSVSTQAEFRKALWETAELLARLAWGEKPPTSYHAKFGWLDVADVTLFCQIRRHLSDV